MHLGSDNKHQWGVILAGGEGSRLKIADALSFGRGHAKAVLSAAGRADPPCTD